MINFSKRSRKVLRAVYRGLGLTEKCAALAEAPLIIELEKNDAE